MNWQHNAKICTEKRLLKKEMYRLLICLRKKVFQRLLHQKQQQKDICIQNLQQCCNTFDADIASVKFRNDRAKLRVKQALQRKNLRARKQAIQLLKPGLVISIISQMMWTYKKLRLTLLVKKRRVTAQIKFNWPCSPLFGKYNIPDIIFQIAKFGRRAKQRRGHCENNYS